MDYGRIRKFLQRRIKPKTLGFEGKNVSLWVKDAPKDIRSIKFFLLSKQRPEDHWSCIAHQSAEVMIKSAVIQEKSLNIALG